MGGNNNNGSTLASSTLPTDLVSGATIDNAYIRHDEKAATAGGLTASDPQNFSLTAPTGLLNNAFGVAVGIQDKLGTTASPCVGKVNACTVLTVPAAKFAESAPGTPFPGNPFYDGIVTHPYTWEMDAAAEIRPHWSRSRRRQRRSSASAELRDPRHYHQSDWQSHGSRAGLLRHAGSDQK